MGNPVSKCTATGHLGEDEPSRPPPAVPSVLFTSPGMVCALFLSFTEHPKSPSLMSPEEVRKMLAPNNKQALIRLRSAERIFSTQAMACEEPIKPVLTMIPGSRALW